MSVLILQRLGIDGLMGFLVLQGLVDLRRGKRGRELQKEKVNFKMAVQNEVTTIPVKR